MFSSPPTLQAVTTTPAVLPEQWLDHGSSPSPLPTPDPRPERRPETYKFVPHLRLVETPPKPDPLLDRRDPAFIRRVFPQLSWVTDRYFRAEVEGVEHLSERASVIATTHNGGLAMPDLQCLFVAFWRRFGLETPGHGLVHRQLFRVPVLGNAATRLGALEACAQNARRVLEADRPLLICPGGDVDSLKPFSQRHRVCFGKRRGFIRLAIERQAPIIPVVSVGAHETLFVLNDGQRLARLLGVDRLLRVKTIPLVLSFPFGLTPGGVLSVPLPSKIRLRILPPIELGEPPAAANDAATVERCFEHVRQRMQTALDDLASKRKRVLFG